MSDQDFLQGVHTDHSDPKAGSHAPDLTLDGNELRIDLSDHSETAKHHTTFIEIYADDTPAGYLKVEPDHFGGITSVTLSEDDQPSEIRVRAKCNLHGTWETTLSL